MSETSIDKVLSADIQQGLVLAESAVEKGQLTSSAFDNLKIWLTEAKYAEFVPQILQHVQAQRWQQLDDVFWTVIPFGTGGRRGMMYPFGSNAINSRTIGESAQGLARYIKQVKPEGPWSMAIAYDTRHRSREFAELCASVMVANGFKVYFLNDYRSTPELSFLVRYRNCDCGIMVTASHNPPSDNAVKVYWSSGAQLIPPHDQAVIDQVMRVEEIPTVDFQTAVQQQQIQLELTEIDDALRNAEAEYSFPGSRDIKIIYSPLHGVGEFNVRSLLQQVGFSDLEIYEPHRQPSPDFPNVPGHVSNPENSVVFNDIIERGKEVGANLILATDPDADRMGAAAPITLDPAGQWSTLNGNQLGVLLCDYVLRQMQATGRLTPRHYVITTLVTTSMIERIAESYGVSCHSENLVGFKWICSLMDELGASRMAFSTEESHGFLVGDYCRDKDGAVACLLMAELAAWAGQQNLSLFQHLENLYRIHGYHQEYVMNIAMKGSDGMKKMQQMMERFRSQPPGQLGGLKVSSVRDYQTQTRIFPDGSRQPISGPQGDLVIFETEQPGNYIAARPSGTEPKIKFYLFAKIPADQLTDFPAAQATAAARIEAYMSDMQAYVE
jgi:phosphomannomutase